MSKVNLGTFICGHCGEEGSYASSSQCGKCAEKVHPGCLEKDCKPQEVSEIREKS